MRFVHYAEDYVGFVGILGGKVRMRILKKWNILLRQSETKDLQTRHFRPTLSDYEIVQPSIVMHIDDAMSSSCKACLDHLVVLVR
jgi:hypothetical protein